MEKTYWPRTLVLPFLKPKSNLEYPKVKIPGENFTPYHWFLSPTKTRQKYLNPGKIFAIVSSTTTPKYVVTLGGSSWLWETSARDIFTWMKRFFL